MASKANGYRGVLDWTKKMPHVTQKECQVKGKHDVTDSVNTFSCLETACIATFKTTEEADEHMDTGHHIMTPEKKTIHDNLRRQWAAVMTSVKVTAQKIGRTDYVPLTSSFNKGAKDLHQKAMPADVLEQIKKTFPVSEWYRQSQDTFLGWLRSKRDFQLAKTRVRMKRWIKRITWSN